MSNRIDLGMDIQQGVPPATNSGERGRNPSPSAKSSRESSLASSGRSTPYHERMEIDVVQNYNYTIYRLSTILSIEAKIELSI